MVGAAAQRRARPGVARLDARRGNDAKATSAAPVEEIRLPPTPAEDTNDIGRAARGCSRKTGRTKFTSRAALQMATRGASKMVRTRSGTQGEASELSCGSRSPFVARSTKAQRQEQPTTPPSARMSA